MPSAARFLGERTRLVEARRPKPFIDAHLIHFAEYISDVIGTPDNSKLRRTPRHHNIPAAVASISEIGEQCVSTPERAASLILIWLPLVSPAEA